VQDLCCPTDVKEENSNEVRGCIGGEYCDGKSKIKLEKHMSHIDEVIGIASI
jgi:hypothetical protein